MQNHLKTDRENGGNIALFPVEKCHPVPQRIQLSRDIPASDSNIVKLPIHTTNASGQAVQLAHPLYRRGERVRIKKTGELGWICGAGAGLGDRWVYIVQLASGTRINIYERNLEFAGRGVL